jgi:uncharacterized Zn finger protein
MKSKLPTTICDKCGSLDLEFSKLLGIGYIGYIVKCNNCGKKRHVARTKEVYEIVKDQPWVKSKELKKRESLRLL